MTFQPGHKFSPGRKKGSKNKKTLLRQQIEACGPELIARIKTIAFNEEDGNAVTALGMLLARLEAPLRPAARTVEFEFDPNAAPGENANRVMAAVAAGEIDPDTGHRLLNMLAATVGIADIETFAAELHRLRGKWANYPRGGVKEMDEATVPTATPQPAEPSQPAMAKKPWEK
jgi:hypothetical protein